MFVREIPWSSANSRQFEGSWASIIGQSPARFGVLMLCDFIYRISIFGRVGRNFLERISKFTSR